MNTLGVVLAGGKSSRMGIDKAGLAHVNGPTLLERSQSCLHAAGFANQVVSGKGYQVEDLVADIGPIAALLSVLTYARRQGFTGCLILPVDMPLVLPQQLKNLARAGVSSASLSFYQPSILPLYIPANELHLTQIQRQIEQGHYALNALLDSLPYQAMPTTNPEAFKNLNTLQEWQAYCRTLEQEDN